jgi:L-seryl-tRNA(Ser) seleniumtransferase
MSGTGEFGTRGTGSWTAKRAAAPPAVDVAGTWTVEVETAQGTGTPSFTFKQEGNKLSGQYRGLFGEAPLTGTMNGSAIVFSVDVTVEGNTVRITYSGTVEKDTMKGTVKLGDIGEGTFKGTRKG